MRISDWSSDRVLFRSAVMPIGRFKDAALIQNGRAELRQVEMIQLLIVGNTDAFAIARCAGMPNFSASRTICDDTASGARRSEERRVGKAWGGTCRSRWQP